MDPRERADAALAKARARGAFVVTPESAVSPMDAANTLQLPRIVVSANDEGHDPNATLVVPRPDMQDPPTEDNIPAIAQESFTDVVGSPPGIRSRQRRIEDARARAMASRPAGPEPAQAAAPEPAQPAPTPRPAPAPRPQPAQPEALGGLIPTTKQPPTGTGSLSQRLDG